jgi:hypothetical protein
MEFPSAQLKVDLVAYAKQGVYTLKLEHGKDAALTK